MRSIVWIGVIAVATLAEYLRLTWLTLLALGSAFVLLGLRANSLSLRVLIGVIAISAGAIDWYFGFGVLLEILPVLILSLVAWLFARTLNRGRLSLIGRAIAAIDGPQWLGDVQVAAYARRLTAIWAGVQILLALITLLLVGSAHGWFAAPLAAWTNTASPPAASSAAIDARMFSIVIVPIVLIGLFLGEFALRRFLLPQIPHQSFAAFVRDLVRVWPELTAD